VPFHEAKCALAGNLVTSPTSISSRAAREGAARPKRVANFVASSNWVMSEAYSPDGRTLATANRPQTAVLWSVSNPAKPTRITTLTGYKSFVEAVAFSPNGLWLATASFDHTMVIWKLPGLKPATHE
jgi:WD40 repeat protein